MPINSKQRTQLVWDFPTRVFHWALVIAICVSFYTGLNGGFYEMDYHLLSGYVVLTLVVFRILWGLLAQGNARFSHFVRGPRTILAYIRASDQENKRRFRGHNPLGAISVIAILTVLLVQVSTGLFANDDITLEGPLAHLVDYDTSRRITYFHHISKWFVGSLIGLHLLAVFYYEVFRKNRLVVPMITGNKLVDEAEQPSGPAAKHQILLALVLIVLCTGFTYYLVTFV